MIRFIRRKIKRYTYIVVVVFFCVLSNQIVYPYIASMQMLAPQAMALRIMYRATALQLFTQLSEVLTHFYDTHNSLAINQISSFIPIQDQHQLANAVPLCDQRNLHTAYLKLPSDVKVKVAALPFDESLSSMYLKVPQDVKVRIEQAFSTATAQKHYAIEAQVCSADLISATRSITNQESPTYIQVKVSPSTQAYSTVGKTIAVNRYYENLINRFEKDGSWGVSKTPRGISIHNNDKTISLSIQGRSMHSGQVLVDRCEYLAEQGVIAKYLMKTVPEFKELVEAQTKHTLDCMVKLTSPNLSDRVIALYELSETSIAGIFGEYADSAIQSLLKGYLHSNGDINWEVIKSNNNYSQGIIKSFISKIKPHVNIDYKVYKPFLKENPGHKKYFLNMASRTGMWFKENVALSCDTDLKTYMKRHPLYQKRLDLINACKSYNFEQAKVLVAQSGNDSLVQGLYDSLLSEYTAKKQLEEQIVAEYNKAIFNEQGFYKACLDNPIFKKLSQSDVLVISQDPIRLSEFNKGLLAQLAIKEKLMEAWHISRDASSEVHQALYKIIQNPAALCTMPEFITTVSQYAKSNPAVVDAFFLPNGVLKDFAHCERARTLPSVPWLVDSKASNILSLLNHLIAIEKSSGSNVSIFKKSSAALNRYHASALSKSLNDIEMDLYQAVDEIIECRKIQLSIVDWGKKQSTKNEPLDPAVASTSAVMAEVQQMFDRALRPTVQICAASAEKAVENNQGICPAHKEQPLPKACATGERPLPDPQGICPEHSLAQEPVLDAACELDMRPDWEWECNHAQNILPGFDDAAGDVLNDIVDGTIGRDGQVVDVEYLGQDVNEGEVTENQCPQGTIDVQEKIKNVLLDEVTGAEVDDEIFLEHAPMPIGEKLLEALNAGTSLSQGFLRHLDLSIGDMNILEEAVEAFKKTPGALAKDGPITRLIKCGSSTNTGDLATARGSAYELETAYKVELSGQNIISFGKKCALLDVNTGNIIKILDIDIETSNSLIECKNWNWSKITEKDILNAQGKFAELQKLASQERKILEIRFKNNIPSNFKNLKSWLLKKNIFFIEG